MLISGLKKVVNYCRVIFEPTSASNMQAPPVILQSLEPHSDARVVDAYRLVDISIENHIPNYKTTILYCYCFLFLKVV
jgi:hypothetical protein